jgi:hypothetical protein
VEGATDGTEPIAGDGSTAEDGPIDPDGDAGSPPRTGGLSEAARRLAERGAERSGDGIDGESRPGESSR